MTGTPPSGKVLVDLGELERALSVCEDAADMTCGCTGYYRCHGCEQDIACRAGDAAEILTKLLKEATDG